MYIFSKWKGKRWGKGGRRERKMCVGEQRSTKKGTQTEVTCIVPSKWEGLATREIVMSFPVKWFDTFMVVPRWYFTSPIPSSWGSNMGLNSWKILSSGVLATFANTFKRPLRICTMYKWVVKLRHSQSNTTQCSASHPRQSFSKKMSCLRRNSNKWHSAFQEDALPTELPRQLSWLGRITHTKQHNSRQSISTWRTG